MSEVGLTWHTDITANLQTRRYYINELLCIWPISSLLMRQLRLRRVKNYEQNSYTQQVAGCKSSLWNLGAFRDALLTYMLPLIEPLPCISAQHVCPLILRALSNTTILPFALCCVQILCCMIVEYALVPWTSQDPEQWSGHGSHQTEENNITLIFTD